MRENPNSPHTRLTRCQATLGCRPVDRAPAYITGISCAVSSAILGRPVNTGTGSLHYAEVAAWAEGDAAHAEFEARLIDDLVAVHRALDLDVLRMPWRMNVRPDARLNEYRFRLGPESGEHAVWQYDPGTADFSAIFQSPRAASPTARLRSEIARLEAALTDPMPVMRAEIAPVVALWRRWGAEFFVTGASAEIVLGPGETRTAFFSIPFIPRLTADEEKRMAELDYAAQRARVVAYWQRVLDHAIPFNVPEPRFNTFARAVIPHIRISATKDPASGLTMLEYAPHSPARAEFTELARAVDIARYHFSHLPDLSLLSDQGPVRCVSRAARVRCSKR